CKNSPARLSDAITVGATDQYDHYNNLSNYGECVDILAPGSSITSIDENGQPWSISGTSMAAPHVTGAAALVLELNPDFNHHQVKKYLLDHATQGVISGTDGAGDTPQRSANKLLYIGDDLGKPLPAPVVNSGDTVQVELLEGGFAYYKTHLGEDAEQLTIEINAEDEVDLFVKYDDVPSANPVNFHNDCKQTHFGGHEVCEFSSPDAGDWHILIASSNPNASIQLNVSHDGTVVDICDIDPQSQACICTNNPADPICDPVVEPGVVELLNLSNLGSSSQLVYQIEVPAGKTLTVTTSGGTGDAELLVNYLQQADVWWASDCSSRNSGNDEECIITQTQPGTYYIVLAIYANFDNVDLVAIYQ
ncbi:MAG: pre-peptidase C-terminal domain-containing protein, partial [Algicola sp.]|nr:pre-peptidase C-terminal domain-containing protein [Algicola sp.]